MRLAYALVCVLACIAIDAAAADGYRCISKHAIELTEAGDLKRTSATEVLLASDSDNEFVVDAKSGRMLGGGAIVNWNDGTGSPRVIDQGSTVQSFKVLTIHGPTFVSVDYLQIETFLPGPNKPFIFVKRGQIVSGTCVLY